MAINPFLVLLGIYLLISEGRSSLPSAELVCSTTLHLPGDFSNTQPVPVSYECHLMVITRRLLHLKVTMTTPFKQELKWVQDLTQYMYISTDSGTSGYSAQRSVSYKDAMLVVYSVYKLYNTQQYCGTPLIQTPELGTPL